VCLRCAPRATRWMAAQRLSGMAAQRLSGMATGSCSGSVVAPASARSLVVSRWFKCPTPWMDLPTSSNASCATVNRPSAEARLLHHRPTEQGPRTPRQRSVYRVQTLERCVAGSPRSPVCAIVCLSYPAPVLCFSYTRAQRSVSRAERRRQEHPRPEPRTARARKRKVRLLLHRQRRARRPLEARVPSGGRAAHETVYDSRRFGPR